MKKVGSMILLFLFLFLFLEDRPVFAAEGKKIAVGINAHLVEFNTSHYARIIDNTAYIPVESFIKGLRSDFTYDQASNYYLVRKAGRWINISISDKRIVTSEGHTKNDAVLTLDGVDYVPLRYIGEYFGFKVEYLPNHQVVRVFNENNTLSHNAFIHTHQKEFTKYFKSKLEKVVYLTFDDGPNTFTPMILDILKQKQATATFFMLEGNIQKYSSLVKRMVNEGHYPGLHSVSHDRNKLYNGNPQNIVNEMEKTRRTLFAVSGVNSYLTRVPYGSKPYLTQAYRNGLVKNGFKMWDWTIDTLDWKHQATNPKVIFDNVKLGLEKPAGQQSPVVILFHDSKGTVHVLPDIIDYVRSKGYEPVAYDPDQHVVVNFWEDNRL